MNSEKPKQQMRNVHVAWGITTLLNPVNKLQYSGSNRKENVWVSEMLHVKCLHDIFTLHLVFSLIFITCQVSELIDYIFIFWNDVTLFPFVALVFWPVISFECYLWLLQRCFVRQRQHHTRDTSSDNQFHYKYNEVNCTP